MATTEQRFVRSKFDGPGYEKSYPLKKWKEEPSYNKSELTVIAKYKPTFVENITLSHDQDTKRYEQQNFEQLEEADLKREANPVFSGPSSIGKKVFSPITNNYTPKSVASVPKVSYQPKRLSSEIVDYADEFLVDLNGEHATI